MTRAKQIENLLSRAGDLLTEVINLQPDYETFHAIVQLKFGLDANLVAFKKKCCPNMGQDGLDKRPTPPWKP